MNNLTNLFFGPLNKESCIYFLFLSISFFCLMVVALVSGLIFLVKKPKEFNFRIALHFIVLFFNVFLAYFVNRLLYTMCSKILV